MTSTTNKEQFWEKKVHPLERELSSPQTSLAQKFSNEWETSALGPLPLTMWELWNGRAIKSKDKRICQKGRGSIN